MSRKDDAAEYLEAARRIAQCEDTYSCIALAKVLGVYDDWNEHRIVVPTIERYARRFTEIEGDRLWLGEEYDCRNIRVIALCFAAAMAEAGDL